MSAAAPPRPRLLLAFPRARAGIDPLFAALLPHLRSAGLAVEHFALDPTAPDASLEATFLAAVTTQTGAVVLGGFSLGARVAAQLAATVNPVALLCLGYPFHARRDPLLTPGLDALRRLRTPTLIIQGTRDPHGDRPQVRSYRPLPSWVRVHWLEDGNHRLVPRVRSGHTLESHLRSAAAATAAFLTPPPEPSSDD